MELTHTLEVRPNLFIRAFIKFYDLSRPYDLNTCKLFWGTLGMIFIPIILLVLSPAIVVASGFAWIGIRIGDAKRAKRDAFYALPYHEREAILAQTEKGRSEWLNKLSDWGSAVWFKIQTPLTWFFRFLIGAIALGVIGVAGYLAVTALPGLPWGDILSIAWQVVLGAILVTGVLYFAVILFFKWWDGRPAKPVKEKKSSVIKAVFASIHNHTCANVKVSE